MCRSYPRQRFHLIGAQHLRSRLFQPRLLQHCHRSGAAETAKCNLQRANAASGCLGDLRDRQRHAGIGAHERFGPAHIAGSGGRLLPPQPLGVVVRQAEQDAERQVLLEGAHRDFVRQQRVGVFQLGEQKVEHAPDRGTGAARLIEHRLECDTLDLLSVQQSLELLAEEPGRQPQKESAVEIALSSADSRLEAKDVSHRGIAGYRFTHSREDQSACAPLDYRDPETINRRQPCCIPRRLAVGAPRQA